MNFYTATRTILKSPEYRYFNSIDEINNYYGIDSTVDDYNCGYIFIHNEQIYLLGYDEN